MNILRRLFGRKSVDLDAVLLAQDRFDEDNEDELRSLEIEVRYGISHEDFGDQ